MDPTRKLRLAQRRSRRIQSASSSTELPVRQEVDVSSASFDPADISSADIAAEGPPTMRSPEVAPVGSGIPVVVPETVGEEPRFEELPIRRSPPDSPVGDDRAKRKADGEDGRDDRKRREIVETALSESPQEIMGDVARSDPEGQGLEKGLPVEVSPSSLSGPESLRHVADGLSRLFPRPREIPEEGRGIHNGIDKALQAFGAAGHHLIDLANLALEGSRAELQIAREHISRLELALEEKEYAAAVMQAQRDDGMSSLSDALGRADRSEAIALSIMTVNEQLRLNLVTAEKNAQSAFEEVEKLQRLLVGKEIELKKSETRIRERGARAVSTGCQAAFSAGYRQGIASAQAESAGSNIALSKNEALAAIINSVIGEELRDPSHLPGSRHLSAHDGVAGEALGGDEQREGEVSSPDKS